MNAPLSEKQAQIPGQSLVRPMLIGGLLVGGATILTWLALTAWIPDLLNLRDGDEEDRPPIIVHNGSVKLRATSVDGDYGEWLETTPGSKKWQHKHDKNGPKKFTVLVTGGSAADGCSGHRFKNVRAIAFVSGGKNWSVGIDGSNNLEVDASNVGAVKTDMDLTLGETTDKLQSATLTLKDGSTRRCNFNETDLPYIVINQKG